MRPAVLRTVLGIVCALVVVLGIGAGASATTFSAPGFSQEVIASGLTDPTAFAFFPDGRILIAQKSGIVRIVKNGALLPTPFINIASRVNDYWDRGLLGIAVDPDQASNPYVYLLYYYENDEADYFGPKTARLTRVTVTGDTASPASEFVILGTVVGRTCNDFPIGTDCIPADAPSHSVGNVKFASDGTLFVTIGDAGAFTHVNSDALRAQNLDSLAGKVLRITRTGQGLPTNPHWTGNASHNRSKVWALGLRNAYRFNLRPGTNMPYLGDVGWDQWEEISVASGGANLGWPCYEGSGQQAGYSPDPVCQALYLSTPNQGQSLAGIGTPIARVPASLGLGGPLSVIRDGDRPPVGSGDPARQYDSWDGNNLAAEDWVGYTFATTQTFARVVFQEGIHFWDGGFFTGSPTVQVRQNNVWVPVSGLVITPPYAGSDGVSFESYTFDFTPIDGDAIRIHGPPGGAAQFISVGEIDVYGPPGGGGGGSPTEVPVAGLAQTVIAKVPSPVGSGGPLSVIRNGDLPPVGSGDSSRQYDSWDGDNAATEDWVGYEFATPQTFTRVVFQEGIHFWDGGFFTGSPTVQVKQNNVWVPVANQVITPAYAGNDGVSFESYNITFTPVQATGIRIHGTPGGAAQFISVGELQVYAEGSGEPSTVTPPIWEYSHAGQTAAVTGGAFYTGTLYPAQYQGALFFGDFSQGWIRTLRVDANDALIPGSVADFAQEADGPVAIEMGPAGRLYYLAITANELRRIQFTAGNTPPTAVASANPTAAASAPLTVTFSSAGSNDPDGDPITFEWNFGDGTPPQGGASVQHTYTANGTYVATLTVRDNRGGVGTDTVTITVGNLPPTATINTPAATLLFKVGDVISYSGSATSQPQDPIPGATLAWQIVLHHCPGGTCHAHPFSSGSGSSGTFTAPDHGDESYFEIILTATDGGGLSHTVSRTIQPQTVQVTLATNPTGLQVVYDGTGGTAPLARTTIVGSTHTISTPSPQGGGTFVSWSDGGAQQHNITVPATAVTYTATFSTGSASCPVGQFQAQYYNNVSLTGNPVLTRCETYPLNYNWGSGGPGGGIPVNNFSARWQGRFNFTAGSWTFTTVSDDGVRLYVDGVRIIDFWTDHAPTTRTATLNVTAGEHEVRIEYYERGGGAVIQASWAGGGGGGPSEANVASQATAVIARVTAPTGLGGGLAVIRDGDKPPVGTWAPTRQYDSYDGANTAPNDWVGYTFATTRTFTRVVFQEGLHFWDGGFFTGPPTVQVRQGGVWVTVSNLVVTPAYAGNDAESFESYTLTFSQIQGDGIRLFGIPGGAAQFISVGELEAYALVP